MTQMDTVVVNSEIGLKNRNMQNHIKNVIKMIAKNLDKILL